MSVLPALVTSSDLLPNGGPLNGRRSAGKTLLSLWAKHSDLDPLTLAVTNPSDRKIWEDVSKLAGHRGKLNLINLIHPKGMLPFEALFLPDPSIGKWSQWRSSLGSTAFSLIGQIHTLSTPASIGLIGELVTEPIRPWDALICSSRAGKEVVEALIADREEQLIRKFSITESLLPLRPQLPVIPLPIDTQTIEQELPNKKEARKTLGLEPHSHVALWLGRLSILTKLDPWPTYQVLESAAKQLDKPLVLIECGPDDSSEQADHLHKIKELCPNIQFCRLGGSQPVDEITKLNALAASDLAISLVDNTQETFGLAVAEAMAAGLPIVASDWNGYKDLVRDGIDGFLIPSQWSSIASELSSTLGWETQLGVLSYPMMAGCLAQLVRLDLSAAVAGVVTLFNQPILKRAMGEAAKTRAKNTFHSKIVMNMYKDLFKDLNDRRLTAKKTYSEDIFSPLSIDPVKAFSSYPSKTKQMNLHISEICNVPTLVKDGRKPLWDELKKTLYKQNIDDLDRQLLNKHHLE